MIKNKYKIRRQTQDEREKNVEGELPEYKVKLDLTDEQVQRLTEQVKREFTALKDERKELGLEEKWELIDNQYDGELEPNQKIEFNLDIKESKIKSDAITRAIREAFLPDDGDIIDVSPRPEEAREDGFEVAEKQKQYIDYTMDEEVKPEQAFVQIVRSAVNKFVGIGKLVWSYETEKRTREETWEADIKVVGITPDNRPVFLREGMRRFLMAYPDAPRKYKSLLKDLYRGKDIHIVTEYDEVVNNSAKLKYIKLKDFYVPNGTDYLEGLRTAHCVVERQEYTYYELKDMERDGEFDDVDRIFKRGEDGLLDESAKVEKYNILEVTTYFDLDDDGEETKIKCWFSEELLNDGGGCLSAIKYPYYAINIDYIPFYVKLNDYGFYGDCRSVIDDLRDTHIAENALLNLTLHGIYIRNTVTPITTRGSDIESLFLENKFQTGYPLVVDSVTEDVRKSLDFVNYPSMDSSSALAFLEKVKRIGNDVSRVSDLVTGAESELDPTAPAAKTIALLQQSGVGIKDYIKEMLPSFNVFASNLLQLYYQMSNVVRRYRIRSKSKRVTGSDVFGMITRDEMIVKTNIQSRAATFAFDKVNEKREAVAAYNLSKSDPYAQQIPEIQYKAFKNVMHIFGARWKTMVDTDLPSPDEFKKQLEITAMKAIQQLFAAAKQQEAQTGVEVPPQEVISQAPNVVGAAQASLTNPPPQEGE